MNTYAQRSQHTLCVHPNLAQGNPHIRITRGFHHNNKATSGLHRSNPGAGTVSRSDLIITMFRGAVVTIDEGAIVWGAAGFMSTAQSPEASVPTGDPP
jgi:hypothetical protein